MAERDIYAAVLPVVAESGVDLESVTLRPAGKRHILQIVIDCDGGVDLDLVATISRSISDVIDHEADLVPANTVLEVTSPGVDRPLTEERHWRRAVGRLVDVTPRSESPFTDRVAGVSDGVVQFTSGRAMNLADLDSGFVQVEFTGGPDGH
jgi:ribosome maturation factor RimP